VLVVRAWRAAPGDPGGRGRADAESGDLAWLRRRLTAARQERPIPALTPDSVDFAVISPAEALSAGQSRCTVGDDSAGVMRRRSPVLTRCIVAVGRKAITRSGRFRLPASDRQQKG